MTINDYGVAYIAYTSMTSTLANFSLAFIAYARAFHSLALTAPHAGMRVIYEVPNLVIDTSLILSGADLVCGSRHSQFAAYPSRD